MTTAETLGSVFPISISFVSGEQPSNGKFSGWANQTDAGLSLLAKGIGDIWGTEFYDNKLYVAVNRPPHIINLARLIGPASAINPLRPVGDATRTEFDVALDPDLIPPKVNEFSLRDDCNCEPPVYWDASFPAGLMQVHTSIHTALTAIDAAVFATRVATRVLVLASGDYFVDTSGNVLTYDRTGTYSAADETYQTTMAPDMYDQATLNVIPDMNQDTLEGLCDVLSITEDAGISAGEYVVRTPYLTKLSQRDANDNPLIPGDSGCPPVSFGDTTDGERARLPYVLKAALNDGDTIPDGFIGLWDETNNVMITGLTFKLSNAISDGSDTDGFSSEYCVIVTGATLTANAVFPAKGITYRLVTAGTTITETLAALNRRMDVHGHDDRLSGFPILHSNTINRHIAPSAVSSAPWSTEVASPPSEIAGNDHPQYLCRYGWAGTDGDEGQYDNAMLGDLFMARDTSDYTALGYDSDGSSKKIYFSETTTFIYKDGTYNNLRLDGMNLHVGYGENDAAIFFAGTAVTEALKYDTSDSTFYFIDGASGVRGSVLQAGELIVHSRTAHEDPTSLTVGSPTIELFTEISGAYSATVRLQGHTIPDDVLALTAHQTANNAIASGKALTISTMTGDIELFAAGDVKIAGYGNVDSYMVFASLNDDNPVLAIYSSDVSPNNDSIHLGWDGTRYYFGLSDNHQELYLQQKFQADATCDFDLSNAGHFVFPSSASSPTGDARWNSGSARLEIYTGSKWIYLDSMTDV